jgi:hypothetical protein
MDSNGIVFKCPYIESSCKVADKAGKEASKLFISETMSGIERVTFFELVV